MNVICLLSSLEDILECCSFSEDWALHSEPLPEELVTGMSTIHFVDTFAFWIQKILSLTCFVL